MDDQKKQLIDRLQSATNILVTVSTNPSVDQLAACIALTLTLNKMDKHATAVFSGDIPSTIEFLKPAETIEKNTDSLQDFIIALDKSKADKLRYKVEDTVVKIFITPYRTSLSSDDLEFSQGDFNVDAIVALGVHNHDELDQAITSHGRILHDATVTSITNTSEQGLGSINWQDTNTSSLSELVTELVKELGKDLLDSQIATALLTGIVATTDRFRSDNTTAVTMNVAADLMSAGANQQLVTSELAQPVAEGPAANAADSNQKQDNDNEDEEAPAAKSPDGTLTINHNDDEPTSTEPETPDESDEDSQKPTDDPWISPPNSKDPKATKDSEESKDENDQKPDTDADTSKDVAQPGPELPEPVESDLPEIGEVRSKSNESNEDAVPSKPADPAPHGHDGFAEPPLGNSPLTANAMFGQFEPSVDPLTGGAAANNSPLLSHDHDVTVGQSQSQDKNDQPPAEEAPQPALAPEPMSEPTPPAVPDPVTAPNLTPWTPPQSTDSNPANFPPPAPSTPWVPPSPTSVVPPITPGPTPNPLAPTSEPAIPAVPDQTPAAEPAGPDAKETADDVDAAREEVMRALSEQANETLPPIAALNAAPLGPELHGPAANLPPLGPMPPSPLPSPESILNSPLQPQVPGNGSMSMPLPAPSSGITVPPPQPFAPTNAPAGTLPPPVPPPMLPPMPQQ